nr:MAG TPA: hypothetical protein [Bacteriophage sp.]
MSLTYGGTTYRSLEEQVRKNMENISTGAESLAALTNKVDNLKTGGEKVSLTFPAGASSGTVTDEKLATLQANDANYIEMVNDKELYYLNDPGHEEGFLTYSHVGIENSKTTIKTLTITVSAKSFVIVTTVIPTGSGKVYMHSMEFAPDSSAVTAYYLYFYSTFNTSITYDNVNEYTNQIPFGILNYVDENGDFKFSSIITGISQGSPGKIIFSKPGIGTQIMVKLNLDNVTEV